MKHFLLFAIGLLVYGCSTTGYQPPCTDLLTTNVNSLYFPLDKGNSWSYDVERTEGSTTTKEEYQLELCAVDTIYYLKDGERIPFQAYKTCRDGEESMNFYFVKCSDGTHMLTVNDWYYKELKSGWLIPNNPEEGKRVENKENLVWRGQETIKVPAGEYQVWVLEEVRELNRRELKMYKDDRIDGDKTVRTRYYFAEGVGLIKTELFGAPGELLTVISMKDYKINKSGGKVK